MKKRFTEEQTIGVLKESEAREVIEDCRKEYSEVMPHSSLGYLPPAVFAKRGEMTLNGATN